MKTKIQELRKQNKVTQEELAFKIARFFEQSIEDIFLYEEE